MRFLILLPCCLTLTVSETGDHDLMHLIALRDLQKSDKGLNVSLKVECPQGPEGGCLDSGGYFQAIYPLLFCIQLQLMKKLFPQKLTIIEF